MTSDRFIVIVSPDKLVNRLGPPVPLELMRFGLAGTLRRLGRPVRLRDVPPSPDGGIIADWTGPVDDPAELAAFLSMLEQPAPPLRLCTATAVVVC